jgi:hypothetical protein
MASRRQGGLMGISEELLGRIGELPGAKNLLDGVNTLRDRVDDLQKRMRGLDELTRRVDALERRVDELSGGKTRRGTARKPASSRSSDPGQAANRGSGRKRRLGPVFLVI